MNKTFYIGLLSALALIAGCSEKDANVKVEDPAFMFWCFRQEVVSDEFRIPEMRTTAAADYLQNRIKGIPGYVESSYDLSGGTMTVSYASSTVRKMNFEEAIAMAGFKVNYRPAYPNVNLPEGVN